MVATSDTRRPPLRVKRAPFTLEHLRLGVAIGRRSGEALGESEVVRSIQRLANIALRLREISVAMLRGDSLVALDEEESRLTRIAVRLCALIDVEFQPVDRVNLYCCVMVPGEGGPDFLRL